METCSGDKYNPHPEIVHLSNILCPMCDANSSIRDLQEKVDELEKEKEEHVCATTSEPQ